MILNVLNNNATTEAYELDEEGFWIQFFNVLNAKGRYGMSPKQIAFMAWILKQDNPNVCWITNPWFKHLEQNFKIQRPEVSSFRKPLTDLELLVNVKDPKKRVNTRPNPRLLKIKERFLKGEEINMCFIMKYKGDESTKESKGNSKFDSRTIADFESEG
jgi:hypothetical protein